jgi:hypothetical protein
VCAIPQDYWNVAKVLRFRGSRRSEDRHSRDPAVSLHRYRLSLGIAWLVMEARCSPARRASAVFSGRYNSLIYAHPPRHPDDRDRRLPFDRLMGSRSEAAGV